MNLESSLNTSRALEGVHGAHVVTHSPFELEQITESGDFQQSTRARSAIGANHALIVQRVWQQRPPCLRPIHSCVHGDRHLAERIANVLTSIPFIAVAINAPRKNLNCKLYANSLIGVGVVSSFYHASKGKVRKYLRWADYTMIAAATVVAFAKRALKDPDLKVAHKVHKMSSLLGGAFFIADDAFPQVPYLHAAWHLAAALGVGACNKLLE